MTTETGLQDSLYRKYLILNGLAFAFAKKKSSIGNRPGKLKNGVKVINALTAKNGREKRTVNGRLFGIIGS